MTRSPQSRLVLCASILFGACLGGCASTPVATSVVGHPAVLPGLPFRIRTLQAARVFVRDYQGNYQEVSRAAGMLTDFARTYALDVRSGPFASPSLTLQMNADNTLKSVQVSGTDETPGAIDAATTAATGIQALDKASATDKLARAQAVLTANNAVVSAEAALNALSPTTSPETRQVYQDSVDAAKRAAAIAREQAGQ